MGGLLDQANTRRRLWRGLLGPMASSARGFRGACPARRAMHISGAATKTRATRNPVASLLLIDPVDERVVQPLMIPFAMIVVDEFTKRP